MFIPPLYPFYCIALCKIGKVDILVGLKFKHSSARAMSYNFKKIVKNSSK